MIFILRLVAVYVSQTTIILSMCLLLYPYIIIVYLGQGLTGKCSHGSSDDGSRYDTATGGIYKGRSVETEAPHYRLHGEASDAALDATEYFLIGEGWSLSIHSIVHKNMAYMTRCLFCIT